MPITDKVAAANQINDFLKGVLSQSGFRLKYRITVNPPAPADAQWEQSEISVDFAGPDSPMLLERNAALLLSLEHLALKMLRLEHEEHDRVSFDCQNSKQVRREELRMAAQVAAERVRKTNMPYEFAPMNSRDRRMLHLTLSNEADLRTESSGEGPRRCVVVYPKDYRASTVARPKPFGRRRR
jgi:spoIIIJ-associated protein